MTTQDHTTGAALRVEVLGPLCLRVAGGPVEVPGLRRRALLALLALGRGRPVPLDRLIDALWPDAPPGKERQAVQTLVSRLRAHLGPCADRLAHDGGGYRLDLGAEEFDVTEAEALAAQARGSARERPAAAADLLGQALALWRGDALAEFADLDALAPDALSLAELRLALEEEHLAATLAAGGGDEVVGRATTLAAAQPSRESRQLLLMRALAAAGRPADALRAGHEYRRRLAEDTGLDPSPALGDLEARIAAGTEHPQPDHPLGEAAADPRLPSPAPAPPRFRTRLVGRGAELAELRRLIGQEHLVAVVGPPGVGKTRLAAELAHALTPDDVGEVAFFGLASVGPTASLSATLAGVLGVRVGPTQTAVAACIERLSTGRQLLFVDNCEHVLGAVRDLVAELSSACPALTVLLTSRVPTGLPGEWIVRLAPLGTGGDGSDAVELFVDRARRTRPDLALDRGERTAVQEIVRRLDGLPLAVELAAGRLSTLSLPDLAARLDGALDLLGAPSPAGGRRTLRSTLEWSYDLLDDDQRSLLRHLAVFADGLDLAGVEQLAERLGLALGGTVELAALVDASLVDADLDGSPRYRMLETVRALALDHQRRRAGEAEAANRAMLEWAVETAAEIERTSQGPDEPLADRRLRRELANLRAAHHYALDQGDLDTAVTLTVSLDEPASLRDLPEVWGWALRLAEWPGIEDHPRHVEVLGAAAEAAWLRGDLDGARALAEAGLGLAPRDPRCLHCLATVSLFRADLDRAEELWRAAAERDAWYLASATLAAAYAGRTEDAWDLQRETARRLSEHGSLSHVAFTHYAAAEIGPPDAEARYEIAVDLARRSGSTFVEGVARVGLAVRWATSGRRAEALAAYDELVRHWRRTGSWTQQWTTLRNVAWLLERSGEEEAAVVLRASAAAAPEASVTTEDERSGADPLPRGAAVDLALEAIARLRAG